MQDIGSLVRSPRSSGRVSRTVDYVIVMFCALTSLAAVVDFLQDKE